MDLFDEEFHEMAMALMQYEKENEGRYAIDPAKEGIIDEVYSFFKRYCDKHGGLPEEPEFWSSTGRVSTGAGLSSFEVEGDELREFAEVIEKCNHFWLTYDGKMDSIDFGNMRMEVSIKDVSIEVRGGAK